ncbi:MAG: hypothetical protein V7641_1736 [Blastocatellia bacterium]
MPEEPPLLLPPAKDSPAADAEPAAAREPELAELGLEPAEPLFVCKGDKWARTVCEGEPFFKEHEGKQYCVLHYPGKEKSAAFDAALQKKLEAEDFNFRGVWFPEAANFTGFEFSAAATFRSATFKDQLSFSGSESFGNQTALDLQFSRIDKADLVSFHTVTLHPHWFVNIDPRKFVFTDVSWNWQAISIDGEIQSLEAEKVSSPRRLLAIACRQLAENAETNNRYEEASQFRYWAMDLARQQK